MRDRMRKVLIISYTWPPMGGVGFIRASKFAKYLPSYGWEPVILTVRPGLRGELPEEGSLQGIRVHRTEYRDVVGEVRKAFAFKTRLAKDGPAAGHAEAGHNAGGNRVTSFIREIVTMPDDQIGWLKFAVEEGKRVMDEERIDLVFSTSPPETAHLIARSLKRYRRTPWIADMRDLWSDDHFRRRTLFKKLVLKTIEANVLKDADKIITVSEPWADKLRSSSLRDASRIEVIENGFDEEDFNGASYYGNNKFTITYSGKLHKDHQDIGQFLLVLKDLIEEGRIDRRMIEIKFHVLGYDRPDITAAAESLGIGDVVKELGPVPYLESLRIQRSSDVLLFVQWRGEGDDGWYSGKLYDYIGSRRPILALARNGGIIEDLIRRTASGTIAHDREAIRSFLLRSYGEHLKNGRVAFGGDEAEIVKQSRKIRTAKLASLFDSI